MKLLTFHFDTNFASKISLMHNRMVRTSITQTWSIINWLIPRRLHLIRWSEVTAGNKIRILKNSNLMPPYRSLQEFARYGSEPSLQGRRLQVRVKELIFSSLMIPTVQDRSEFYNFRKLVPKAAALYWKLDLYEFQTKKIKI